MLCTAGCFAALILLAVVVIDVSLHRTETMGEVHRQPASVRYDDASVHYAGVVHSRSLLFDRHRSHDLYTGRYRDLGYGHFVRLGFGRPGRRPVIKTVDWSGRGVRVAFTSGHEVFVPARHFVGGR